MFQKFTDSARRVLVMAKEEARALDRGYIGTEHILLGLLDVGEGIGAASLAHAGLTADSIRDAVSARTEEPASRKDISPPFTPRAKKALELSLRESLQLGSAVIDTEHVLLGLLRQDNGPAIEVLEAKGVSVDDLRNKVIEAVHGVADTPLGPRCPHCLATLEHAVSSAVTIEVGDSGEVRSVAAIHCGRCARLLGFTPEA